MADLVERGLLLDLRGYAEGSEDYSDDAFYCHAMWDSFLGVAQAENVASSGIK